MNKNCVWPIFDRELDPKFHERVKVTQTTLSNGMRTIVATDPNDRSTYMSVLVNAGSVHNSFEHKGLAHFVEHCVHHRTPYWKTRTGMQEFVRKYNLNRNAFTASGVQNFHVESDNDDESIDAAARFLSGIALFSDIPNEAIPLEISTVTSERVDANGRFEQVAWEHLQNSVLDERHPLFQAAGLGKVEDIAAFTHEAVVDFYKRIFTPANMVLVIVGGVDSEKYLQLAEKYFSEQGSQIPWNENPMLNWMRNPAAKFDLQKVNADFERAAVHKIYYHKHDAFEMGTLEKAALSLANLVLHDRLFNELRYKRGLVYSSHFEDIAGIRDDVLVYQANLKLNDIEEGNKVMDEVLAGLSKNPITDDEFANSLKNRLSTRWARTLRDSVTRAASHLFSIGQLLSPEWQNDLYLQVTKDKAQEVLEKAYAEELKETLFVGKLAQ